MDSFWLDLRAAWRAVRGRPGFSALVIGTLAIAVGANSGIFSVVDTVLLQQLPYRAPERLFSLWVQRSDGDEESISVLDLADLAAGAHSLQGVAGWAEAGVNLTGTDQPERLFWLRAGPGFFEVLGAAPALGRGFQPADYQDGGARVVVLSDALWRRRFGGDPSLLGRSIQLNDESWQVVGVMPEGFLFPGIRSDLLVPLDLGRDARAPRRDSAFLRALARLAPGASREQALAELNGIARALQARFPLENGRKSGAVLRPIADELVGKYRGLLSMLLGAVGVVLLLACTNLASLLLAQGAGRQHELAVKLALGAARGRIVRQLLLESLILGAAGGLLAAAVGGYSIDLLVAISPAQIPRLQRAALDGRVLAFTAAAALFTSLGFGILPALLASRQPPAQALGDGRSSAAPSALRARRALVAIEVALSLSLLAAGGLLLRSFERLLQVDPGFRPGGALSLRLSLPARYLDRQALVRFQEELRARLLALPGVSEAGSNHVLPLSGALSTVDFTVEGRPPPRKEEVPQVHYRMVSPGYLRAIGILLVAGRDLTRGDGPDAPQVAIVNRRFAERHFAGQSPIGAHLLLEDGGGRPRAVEIVGLCGDVHQAALDGPLTTDLYVPVAQAPEAAANYARNQFFIVRGAGDPRLLVRPVLEALRAQDGALPASAVLPLDEVVAASLAPRRFNLLLVEGFAAAALLLSAIGIYALTAQSVAQRRREMGIRLALGALPGSLASLVVREGMRPVLAGIGAGLVAAAAGGRLLSGLLFEVSPLDPATLAAVTAGLGLTALFAAWIPARRAAKADPLQALRAE